MHSPYTTDVLAHFVGRASPKDHSENFRKLALVLESGQVSYAPHTKEADKVSHVIDPSKRLDTEELIVPTVTCFADIPDSSLGVHVSKYGRFGVGFRRDFVIRAGARPVTYVPMFSDEWRYALNGRGLLQDMRAIYLGFRNHYEARIPPGGKPVARTLGRQPSSEDEALFAVRSLLEKDFLAFVKPFNSELATSDPDNFYMEREWRKYAYLHFELADVARVWVAPGYGQLITSRFPELADRVFELGRNGLTLVSRLRRLHWILVAKMLAAS